MKPVENPVPSDRLKLLIYWTMIGIPLIWGVFQTVVKALKLYQSGGI